MTELTGAIAAVFILYLLLMVGIGFFTSRRTHSPVDFFLANRSLKAWVTAISSTASSESAWAVLGTVGLAYKDGLSAIWFLPGCLLGYAVNWFLIAEPLRRHCREEHTITLPDYLEAHFNDRSHLLRAVSVIIIFFCMMAYVASQFTAVGKTFDSIFGIPHTVSIPVGAVIILSYTAMGGVLAVAWTDFIQGLIMVAGLVFLSLTALMELGGPGGLVESLHSLAPQALDWTGGESFPVFFGSMIGLLGIGLGYPGQPHLLTRYMAAKNRDAIRQGVWIALGWGFLMYSSSILMGLCGRVLLPGLDDPEHLFPRAAEMLLPAVLAAVVLTGVLAAIMSTVSAQIMVATSAVAHDIYRKLLNHDPSHEKILWISRVTVVVLGLGAVAIALTQVRVIFWFVLFAWSGLGASFGPVILSTLYFPQSITRAGALAGLLTGFITTVVWKVSGLSDRIIYELVPAFLFSFLAIWFVSRRTARKDLPASLSSASGEE